MREITFNQTVRRSLHLFRHLQYKHQTIKHSGKRLKTITALLTSLHSYVKNDPTGNKYSAFPTLIDSTALSVWGRKLSR